MDVDAPGIENRGIYKDTDAKPERCNNALHDVSYNTFQTVQLYANNHGALECVVPLLPLRFAIDYNVYSFINEQYINCR